MLTEQRCLWWFTCTEGRSLPLPRHSEQPLTPKMLQSVRLSYGSWCWGANFLHNGLLYNSQCTCGEEKSLDVMGVSYIRQPCVCIATHNSAGQEPGPSGLEGWHHAGESCILSCKWQSCWGKCEISAEEPAPDFTRTLKCASILSPWRSKSWQKPEGYCEG